MLLTHTHSSVAAHASMRARASSLTPRSCLRISSHQAHKHAHHSSASCVGVHQPGRISLRVGAQRRAAPSDSQQQAATSPGVCMRTGTQADLPYIQKNVLLEMMNPLGLDPSRFVVAVQDGDGKEEIRGFGQMEQKNEGEWELRSLVVDKNFRGQGIGSSLVEALKTRVPKGQSAFLVTLAVRQGFYKRFGFDITEPPSWLKPEAALGQIVSRVAGYPDGLVVMGWRNE